MKLIAAVDQNWNLGYRGELLFRIPADLKRFRALTTGNVIVMGRKTLLSMPGGKPLPQRDNIDMTRDTAFDAEGATVAQSIAELFELLRQPVFAGKEVYVIGGAEIYAQLLPYCDSALITHVNAAREADCKLENLGQLKNWVVAERSEEQAYEDISFSYVTYQNTWPASL